jgi:hypothetical protein
MSPLLLLLLIPLILAPIVCLLGFAGCGATLYGSPLPKVPEALRIVTAGPTTMTLGWLDPNILENTYELERTRDGDSTSLRVLVTTPMSSPTTGELTFLDTDLEPSTVYFYQIRAVRISDDSASALSEPAVSASTLA